MVKCMRSLLLFVLFCEVVHGSYEIGRYTSTSGVTKRYLFEKNLQDPYISRYVDNPLTIESKAEETYLFGLINASGLFDLNKNVYTSGIKLNSKWVWVKTNASISYGMKWRTGMPDNKGGLENCLTILKGDTEMGFNDYNCNYVNVGFLWQEIIIVATTQAPITLAPGTTRAPAVSFGSTTDSVTRVTKSYTFEKNTQSPYLSKSSCSLLTIDNKAEETYIFNQILTNSIFPTDKDFYVGGVKVNGQWAWEETNNPISYGMKWYNNQPDNQNGQENCLTISKRSGEIGFNDFGCTASNVGFICQEIYVPTVDFGSFSDTSTGLIKTYKFEKNQQSPYVSKSSCSLLTIGSKAEETYIFNEISKNSNFPNNKEFYIGGVRSNNQWVWEGTNNLINYGMQWNNNQPDNQGGQENCLTISKGAVIGFNDFSCTASNVGFICQETHLPPRAPAIELGTYTDTVTGTIKRYRFESNQQTPYLSKSNCSLLTINSQAEEFYVFYRIAINSDFPIDKDFYVDGVKFYSQWVWNESATLINYGMQWRTNQPDNAGGQENCLSIKKGSSEIGYNDFGCNNNYAGFICQEIVGYV